MPLPFPTHGCAVSHCLCSPAAACLKCTMLLFLPCVAASFRKSCWNFVNAASRIEKKFEFKNFGRNLNPPLYNTANEIK